MRQKDESAHVYRFSFPTQINGWQMQDESFEKTETINFA